MQFSTIAISTLLATLVSAAPAVLTEDITINTLYVRNIDNAIQSTAFNIQPDNVNCTGLAPALNSTVGCDTDNWSFYIHENLVNNYALSIYKQTGQSAGIWNMQNVTLICRAGGSSILDFVCSQPPITNQTIAMTLNPTGPYPASE